MSTSSTTGLVAACGLGMMWITFTPCVNAAGDTPANTIRVNEFTRSAQHEVVLDADERGIAAAWSSRRQREGRSGVYLRFLQPDGTPRTAEIPGGLTAMGHQTAPAIASDGRGGAWVAWTSHGQDGDGGAIIARHFDERGVGGSEILVNEATAGSQDAPVVAALADGGAAFAWTSEPVDGTQPRVVLRVVDGRGAPRCGDVVMAMPEAPFGMTPAIASHGDRIAVAWTALDGAGESHGIGVALLDGTGRLLSAPAPVDLEAARGGVEPAIARCGDGFSLGWLTPTVDGFSALVSALDAHGCAVGQAIAITADGEARQSGLSLADSDGDRVAFAINEARPGVENTIRVGVLDLAPSDPMQRVSTLATIGDGAKKIASIRSASGARHLAGVAGAGGGDGAFALAWNGNGDRGDETGAHVSMVGASLTSGASPRDTTVAWTASNAAPADATTASPHDPPTFDPRAVERGRRNFSLRDDAFGFDVVLNTGWTPPDPSLAVGPDHLVGIVNGGIRVLDKNGVVVLDDAIEGAGGFWGSVGATSFVFDPEALYDSLTGRFWVMASEANAPGGKSFALIAVSQGPDPAGPWHRFRLETTALAGSVFDSPNMGVDSQAVYVSGDGANNAYPMFIYDKQSMLAGQPPAIVKSLLVTTATQSAAVPPVTTPDAAALYLVEHGEASSNSKVRLMALRNPLTAPIVDSVDVTVPTYASPPEDPPQKGTSIRPETFDVRFWSSAYANGSLWATHHVGSSRVLVRWYQFALNGWPLSGDVPTLAQSGTIDPGPAIRTYFSAITADAVGNAAIVFARSSPTEFISMQMAMRAASDPLGSFRAATSEQINTGPYTSAARWGDYAGVAFDPAAPLSAWAHHEYAIGGSWRTWAAKRSLPSVPGDLNQDGVVDGADLGILLSAWGAGPGSIADLNGDGMVDGADLGILLSAWSGA